MENIHSKTLLASLLGCAAFLPSCNDGYGEIGTEADIEISFKVTGSSGTVFNSVIGEDTIIIKVSPYLDANEELKNAKPSFYLSKGATVSPDPSEEQDFAQDGGVRYTVVSQDGGKKHDYVVTWGISDNLPYGEGFTYAEIGAKKSFAELGYPGEVSNFSVDDSKLYGDLQMYHAYCGDHIVLLSRGYISADAHSPYAIKVVDKATLDDAGALNLGSVNVADIKMLASDYKGRCVAAVVSNGETEFFYWERPSDAPVSAGKINVDMAPSSDLSNNFQVAGDIKGDAWITALAPRGAKGAHYRVKVSGGALASSYSTVETGYASDDCAGFQMISPLDDSDSPGFVIGDTEGTANAANSIHCYINTHSGLTVSTMPAFWQSTLQTWWVGTGFSTARTGGRAPVVSALPINGKTYVVVTSGTAWWHSAAVLSSDLQTLAHENLNIAYSVNRGWSFGGWVDWYWDESENAAYLAVWFGRLGLYTYKMTCYE